MRFSWSEIRARAAAFSESHKADHYEKGQTQTFYNDFFDCFGVSRAQVATYEQRVRNLPGDKRGFIDLLWPGTLLIEQKSAGLNLRKASDQALDYYDWLPESQRPRYILTCDFQRWELLDLEEGREWRFLLADLKNQVEAFAFILGVQPRLNRRQSPANVKASQLMGKLHEALAESGYGGHDLELLLVRLLFILFADDTSIFNNRDQFHDLIERRTAPNGSDLGRWLGDLFEVLNTHGDRRQRTLDADLGQFPYVNGRLFEERIRMPAFDNAMRSILLDACEFDWGDVSPAIFGGLFESVIDKVTRRKQGAHYTPEDAILRLIGPLFLDELQAELARCKLLKTRKDEALARLHDRIAGLAFLDPACGAGNFLVVAYRELRELERELIKERFLRTGRRQEVANVGSLSRIDVDQFFGIEIDEFPARIAEVALWMTDHIANQRLGEDFGQDVPSIPLVASPGIRHADALEVDWNDVLAAERCSYVMGNPPFVGFVFRGRAQQEQTSALLEKLGATGSRLDYVAAWFLKAAHYVAGGPAVAAFVGTNSITQGEQVSQLWPAMFRAGVEIYFAHRTFVWSGRAAVHCVIVGFGPRALEPAEKRLFSYVEGRGEPVETKHDRLTAYLFDATEADHHLVVKRERTSLCGQPLINVGTKPVDGGHLIYDAARRRLLLDEEPNAASLLRPFIGGREFINGEGRWLLHAQGASPAELRAMPAVRRQIAAVRAHREQEGGALALSLALDPTAYHVTVIPEAPFLVIPEVSSERREYVPIGWVKPPTIPSNQLLVVQDATLWHFGILTSRAHQSWLRHIGGRLKSDVRYSSGLVYNTFPLARRDTSTARKSRNTRSGRPRRPSHAQERHLKPRRSLRPGHHARRTAPRAPRARSCRRQALPRPPLRLRPRARRTSLPALRSAGSADLRRS